ncbi:ABC transporter permease [Actinoplanes sp. NPDC026619]|uniref:ABC transporter permease n=1 Tax=Actinoplanes sp. NPDC026619 TaxID=3155798 RepID=UPI0033E82AAA
MFRTWGTRILGSLALIVIVPSITFLLQSLTPVDIGRSILGLGASQDQVDAYNHQLGLDRPFLTRYWDWLTGFAHGDLGTSYTSGEAVTTMLGARLPVSLALIIGSLLIFTVVGLLLGVLSAGGGRIVGRVVDVVSSAGIAIPNFWLGVILVSLFAVKTTILPATGYVPFAAGPGDWFRSLVLPVVALSFAGITAVAKQTRDQMMVALTGPYIRSLRANGVPERSLVYRHALRNASGPTVTVLGLIFVGALSGSVVVENIFVLPGLGSQAVTSAGQHDLPVIQGIAVYFTTIVVVVNVVVDLAIPFLNPKARAR